MSVSETPCLTREFFSRPALQVARELLGSRLVRVEDGYRIAGLITEAEAYQGEEDLGCHCHHGRTPRTTVMYGPPGYSYVYFTYGMHWMLNFVVADEGYPAAVLIRAVLPNEGLDIIAARRSAVLSQNWTNGPAKICQAFNIDRQLNAHDLCSASACLFVEAGQPVPDESVTIGPRVGLNTVPEPWKSVPWRFLTHYFESTLSNPGEAS